MSMDGDSWKPCVICDLPVCTDDSEHSLYIDEDRLLEAGLFAKGDVEEGPAHRSCYVTEVENNAEREGMRQIQRDLEGSGEQPFAVTHAKAWVEKQQAKGRR